jgi:hypothetical protein
MGASMTEMTIKIPDEWQEQLNHAKTWIPAILRLSLTGFKTPVSEIILEITAFLGGNPSTREVLDYHLPPKAQSRLRRLLTLNQAAMLNEREEQELDEFERLERIMMMLKAEVAKQFPRAV